MAGFFRVCGHELFHLDRLKYKVFGWCASGCILENGKPVKPHHLDPGTRKNQSFIDVPCKTLNTMVLLMNP